MYYDAIKSLTFSNLMAFWLYRSTRVNGKTNCTINQMLMSLTFNNATGSQQYTLSEQFQNLLEKQKKYHTVGTIPKSTRKTKKYHTVGTIPKSTRKTKKYHTVGKIPKSTRKTK
jgi:hypothetical protein